MKIAEHEARFTYLVMALVENVAKPAEIAEFQALLRQYPEFKLQYIEQIRMHGLMVRRQGALRGVAAMGYEPMRTSGTLRGMGRCARARLPLASEMPPGYRLNDQSAPWLTPAPLDGTGDAAVNSGRRTGGRRMSVRFRKVVALAAAMGLVATGLWLAAGDGRSTAAVTPVAGRPSPVEILHRWGSCNLEVPERLPGTMRMTNGRITALLSSGIELILLGPFELEIRTPMEAKLLSGRLLAEVSKSAGGFMLHTPDFEMWDNGALFGVTVTDKGSDVFVFEGEVQVVEACGEPVDICRTGEGARARRDGSGAVKIAADWPEAERMLARVKANGAHKDTEDALGVASLVSDEWAVRWMPQEAWRILARHAIAAAERTVAGSVPFSKEPWVRSSAPARQEEANMRKASVVAALAASATIMGAMPSGGTSTPLRVDTSPYHNRHWMTVFTNEVPLRWEWPAAAESAELSMVGMGSTFATNFLEETTAYLWRVFETPQPAAENLFTLTLTCRDAEGGVVATQSARIAVLAGAFGKAAIDPGPSDRKWAVVKENAVIPYDATWAAATAGAVTSRLDIAKSGGVAQDNMLPDAAGYFGWKLVNSGWGYGVFLLTLGFPGFEGEWPATLTYVPAGTVISLK